MSARTVLELGGSLVELRGNLQQPIRDARQTEGDLAQPRRALAKKVGLSALRTIHHQPVAGLGGGTMTSTTSALAASASNSLAHTSS
jgi:hypothetical protein